MPVELATAYVSLVPSLKGAQGAIASELGGLGGAGGAGGAALGGGIVGGLKGALGPVAGVMAGVFAAGSIVSWGKEQIDSLKRIETLNAQSASAIKATGSAAGVTSQHIQDLTGALENSTATEAESIQEGANLLLTFKNIKNEAGDGNDVFDQTTRIMTDMARAMGTDVKGGAIQLGKALNDPVKGISALSRVGVTFTDDQKKMIQSMVDAGDTMGAQKVILNELNSEFGGAAAAYAATYAGKVDLLGHAWGTFGETLFQNVTPALGWVASGLTGLLNNVLTPMAGQVSAALTGAASAFGGFVKGIGDAISYVVGYVTGAGSTIDMGWLEGPLQTVGDVAISAMAVLAPIASQLWSAIAPLAGQFLSLWTQISPLSIILQALTPILPTLTGLLTQLAGTVSGVLQTTLVALAPILVQLAEMLGGVLAQAATILVPIFGQIASVLGSTFISLLGNLLPIVSQLASTLGGALANSLTLLGPIFSALGPILGQIVSALGSALQSVISALMPILPVLVELFTSVLSAVLPLVPIVLSLVTALVPLLTPLLDLVGTLLPPLIGLFAAILTPILQLVGVLVSALVPILQIVVGILAAVVGGIATALTWFVNLITGSGNARDQIAAIWGAISGFFSGLWGQISGFFSDGIAKVVGFVGDLNGKILGALKGAGTWLLDVGKNIVQGLIDGVSGMVKKAVDAVKNVGGKMLDGVKDFLGIHSPSRRFRDEVGAQTINGAIEGVESRAGALNSLWSDVLAVPAPGSFVPSLPSTRAVSGVPFAAAAAAGAGSDRPAVEQHIHPAPGMSEETIGRVSADSLNYLLKQV